MTLQPLFNRIIGSWKHDSNLDQNYNKKRNKEEEARITLVQLIQSFGYPVEVFQNVETEDNYLLDIYRIPYGKSPQYYGQRPVVLITHSLLASCTDYVLMGPERGLAYVLADQGFDVWLTNCRGTKYSCKHKKLNPEVDKEYWNFSVHEIGIYDLVAIIKLIQDTTGCKQLSYIGQSQGTTSSFVLLSEKPHYNKLINIMVCLAPINTAANMPSLFMHCMAKYPIIWEIPAILLKWLCFPPPSAIKFLGYIGNNYCHRPGIIQNVIKSLVFMIVGYSNKPPDGNDMVKILNYSLNPTSVKYFQHFSQTAISGKFHKMDYGHKENLKRYGYRKPPLYDLSNVTCPVALFYSDGDGISGVKDVDILKKQLPNVVVDYLIEDSAFNHLDFSFRVDVADLLYKHVYLALDQYNKKM